ncbi:MAG: FkbM family methyltransferase [Gallionella sp.]
MSSNFLSDYINSAIEVSRNDFHDNYDEWRFGPRISPGSSYTSWIKGPIYFFISKLRLINELKTKMLVNSAVAHIAQHINNYEWLYNKLKDDESRKLLVQVQLYRALGARYVKLPTNNKDYWAKLEAVEKLMVGAETIDLGFIGWKAYKMKLDGLGYPLQLFLRPPGVLTQLLLQQYRCQISDMAIEVVEGDVVIDGGGCYGETALYFALKAGNTGQVFTFEFMPENLSIFNQNMALNPAVAQRVKLIEKPLWDHSGEKLFIEGSGPATRVSQKAMDPNARQIETISIDDLVRDEKLTKLDFIKMDIEGAELHALKGAEESIKKFRPKLAISVYHKPEDFWTIPEYIAGLDLGYRFALRHFTIHQEETVLFAF